MKSLNLSLLCPNFQKRCNWYHSYTSSNYKRQHTKQKQIFLASLVTEILSCLLVQTPSANCWYWSCQWYNEQLIQIELCLEVGVQQHQSHLWAFFLAETRLRSSDWQRQQPPHHPTPLCAGPCQRSLQRLCSVDPSWSKLTWHLFISGKCFGGRRC